jgi:nucleotide-binding universal stress UspA family protein
VTTTPGRAVVVGYDGSDPAEHALRWGARRAARHRAALELVHALDVWPYDARVLRPTDSQTRTSEAHRAAEQLVEGAAERVRQQHPSLEVTTHVTAAAPAALLLERAATAESVAVGSRGHGGFPGLHLGSISSHLTAHAHCPVVVVRDRPGTGVVVGVDGSPNSDRAVAFAFEEASARGEPLTAVHAWLPFYAGLGDMPFYDEVEPVDDELPALLSERLAGWSEQHPEVEVRRVVRSLHPVAALLEASEGAAVLVVGSHGRGGFRGMLLGSVSRSLLHHVSGTIAVVRGDPAKG